ncbi:hypothetical protein GAYE_SCF12G3383 [Galdieria yellowstonensis]|uniref:Uncharacterized protein n=1 Tax=Galdieria yellowstonensis TaxID=3028027 RepID=A0AAV9IDG3_9RHOD|nr:hypothetical protein GAYE_SCF12G3383 [Galdieria yellowstonensis]
MKDKLSAHPVEKYWKERKQREKQKNKKKTQKHSKPLPSIESLEEEIASLVRKKNEGVLLNAERERLVYLVRLHDNILDRHSRNSSHKESSQDPLDPEYGEDNRMETKKRLDAFQRILEKSKVESNSGSDDIAEQSEEKPTVQSEEYSQSTKATRMIPLQVYQPISKTSSQPIHNKPKEPAVEQELNSFYAELKDILGET